MAVKLNSANIAPTDHSHSDYLPKYSGTGNNIYLSANVAGALGYGNLFKNNSATADYGTVLKDVNAGATKQALIQLIAETGTFSYKGTDNVEHAVLHTGNSAKVAIQESAPTDTTALWVW